MVITKNTVEDKPQSIVLETMLKSNPIDLQSLTTEPESSDINSNYYVKMDGKKVYNFAVQSIVETLIALTQKHNIKMEELDYIVCHQANKRILHSAANRLKIPVEKFFINIEKYANTSAASIPIALAEMTETKLLTSGKKVALVGFGAGLTYGGVLLQW